MDIAIIDADLIGRKKHRFPNLASMKLSTYYKITGNNVVLKKDYDNLRGYDKVLISKVFTDTNVPKDILEMDNVEYGGTGFYYDKAPKLPNEIEHIFPDYHLYDEYIQEQISKGVNANNFKEYIDASIGFMTRGCIRQCNFCVNQNYTKATLHSNIDEFFDPTRKYICLLDDNIFACKDWKNVFEELIATKHKFCFKQGMDERLLTEEKCDYLFNKSNYYGDFSFAFDNIKDKMIIEKKLQMIREFTTRQCRFYILCGFNHNNPGVYSEEFWKQDITDMFERIRILMKYKCTSYIMRYKDYEFSPYNGIYTTAARWCNQVSFYKKKSFREFCIANGKTSSAMRYLKNFEMKYPEIAKEYFDMKYQQF